MLTSSQLKLPVLLAQMPPLAGLLLLGEAAVIVEHTAGTTAVAAGSAPVPSAGAAKLLAWLFLLLAGLLLLLLVGLLSLLL
jgi:hypothetical protein